MSNCLWLHGLQYAMLPCPSLSPWVCSDSCPLSWWCYLSSSSSATSFSFCLQSFPVSGSFSMSWLFASGGQSMGASASVSVLPMNIQDWFPLGDLLAVQGSLKSLFQHHNLKVLILLHSAFFIVQLSYLHDYWKNHIFDYTDSRSIADSVLDYHNTSNIAMNPGFQGHIQVCVHYIYILLCAQ